MAIWTLRTICPMRTIPAAGNGESSLGPVFSAIYKFVSIQYKTIYKISKLRFLTNLTETYEYSMTFTKSLGIIVKQYLFVCSSFSLFYAQMDIQI